MSDDIGWSYAATWKCWDCGRTNKSKPFGQRGRHWCWIHWISRLRWRAHLAGWHSGYRFAVEQRDDPMVLADSDDYGTGWAAHMRIGGVEVLAHHDEPGNPGTGTQPGRYEE